MSARILVINEPFVPGFCRTQRWAARTRGRVLRAPDWLAYATAVLERDGFNVKLYDFPAMDWDKKKLTELVYQEKPDFVILDSTTPSIYSDIGCARLVKEASDAKVIMVGPHVSALPKETLIESKGAVDVAVIGEYDYTVRDIIKNYQSPEKISGICYLKNGNPELSPPRALIENLDELPFPAWHQLDLMKYFDGGKLYPYIDVISGRGCPNRCIFCLWPQVMHGFQYRLRSPKNVVNELEYDIKLCPSVLKGGEFFFEDDTFTVNKKRAIEMCEEILSRNLKITFSVNARVDSADRELFAIMKRAGCRELLVGFESGDQEVLNKMHKNITVEKSREFMALAKEARLQVHGCFVIGLPGETPETANKTIDFGLSLGLDTIQFSGAVPFPGTSYFKMCETSGWLKTKVWSEWLQSGEQAGVVEYPGMSREMIDTLVDKGLKRFYFRPSYMIKFLLNTKDKTDLYRKLRGAKNFISYLIEKAGSKVKGKG
ncbi:MAG: radical SAM protein [Elusimicrobiota bacterium]